MDGARASGYNCKDSQLGAIASPQSQVIESREWLDEKFMQLKKEMGKNQLSANQHTLKHLTIKLVSKFLPIGLISLSS